MTTSFLQVIDIPNGTAETIANAVENMLQTMNLPITKFVGLGSDGAAVMVGKKSGVCNLFPTFSWTPQTLLGFACYGVSS